MFPPEPTRKQGPGKTFTGLGRASGARRNAARRRASFRATPKQIELMNAVRSRKYLYIATGGGIRSMKTFGTIATLITLCKIFPRSRWAIVRQDLPTLRRNTLPSLNKLRELTGGFVGEVNQSTWTLTCENGSELLLFPEGLTHDPDLDRWKGLEVNGFLLEEANELAEKSANKAIERAGSWIIPQTETQRRLGLTPKQPPPFVFFTFNPCDNWPRQWFYEPHEAGTLRPPFLYIPATAADNPYVPDDVREAWKNLPPEEYERFILGKWNFSDNPDQLIKLEWIRNARSVEPIAGHLRAGVDVARYGDDNSKIAYGEGNALTEIESPPKMDTTRFGRYVVQQCVTRGIDAADVIMDSVGLGAGAYDTAVDAGFRATEFIAGAAAIPRVDPRDPTVSLSFFKFANLRSQAWWEFREGLRTGTFSLPDELPERLVADLTSVRYMIKGDKTIVVESKDEIKKRIGRSTDDGDAVVMMFFEFPPRVDEPMLTGTISRRSFR